MVIVRNAGGAAAFRRGPLRATHCLVTFLLDSQQQGRLGAQGSMAGGENRMLLGGPGSRDEVLVVV